MSKSVFVLKYSNEIQNNLILEMNKRIKRTRKGEIKYKMNKKYHNANDSFY